MTSKTRAELLELITRAINTLDRFSVARNLAESQQVEARTAGNSARIALNIVQLEIALE